MTAHGTVNPRPELGFSARSQDGWTIVALTGSLDICGAAALREQLLGVLRADANRLVIDLSGVRYCDASGLAVLVGTARRVRLLGGFLRLAAPAPTVAAALRITGLDRQFEVYGTVPAAIGVSVRPSREPGPAAQPPAAADDR